MILTTRRVVSFSGEIRPPSDKSLTHRAYMFAAIAKGESVVRAPLRGEDCESTLRCLNELGLRHEWLQEDEIRLIPPREWMQPRQCLDCGNSGTTMRLLAGLLASRPIVAELIGDESLSRRPMKRIAEPLRQMGAVVEGDTPPLKIAGTRLRSINYRSPVSSAQVKSCVLLAGLRADGVTTAAEPVKSRDHTERMLAALGIEFTYPLIDDGYAVSVAGGQQPSAFEFTVPADISSAAFPIVAAMICKGEIVLHDLLMNPSRTGLLDVLRQCGAAIKMGDERSELGEPIANLQIRAPHHLKPFRIDAELVPRLIDEIPVLAVLATQCEGVTEIRGAGEMRVKESDRIEQMAAGLRAMGADVQTYDDGFSISGPTSLSGTRIEAHGDHRIAMSFAVAGLVAEGETVIGGAESILTSYPSFEQDLLRLSIV
jgi:3-phosphoshikimate 1-carboxyvinyltransferase